MTAFLIDYLVSETYYRSAGQINFPSEYTNTGAYFHNKVYGNRSGQFYDEKGVNLWLPKGLLKTDSIQVNYLAAYGNNKLYLALGNQSKQRVTTKITMNPAKVKLSGNHQCKVWIDNKPSADITMTDGSAVVTISPKGLTCLAVDDAEVITEVSQAMLDKASATLPVDSFKTISTPFDSVTATALRFGKGLTTIHVWLKAGPDKVKKTKLIYTIEGKSQEAVCTEFPYEFTVPVLDSAKTFSCIVEAETPSGTAIKSEQLVLNLAE